MSDTWLHVILALGGAIISSVFTAGVFYTWTHMSIKRCEEVELEHSAAADRKADKNFETLQKLIEDVRKETQVDLSGIGGKVSRIETKAAARFHNLTVAMILVAPVAKESEISELLTER